jgi:putative endonuclease
MPPRRKNTQWMDRWSAAVAELATGFTERLVRRFGRARPEAEHLRTGREGERLAYFHLRRQGYVMVARNWRTRGRKGEIDLIGWDDGVLCFIEVKTRTTHAVAPAEAAVDHAKQRELRGMAALYLRRHCGNRGPRPASRFDVVSVYLVAEQPPEIELFRDAFSWRSMSGLRRPR